MIELKQVQSQAELLTALSIRQRVFIQEIGVPESIEIDNLDQCNTTCTHFIILYKTQAVGTLRCRPLSHTAIKLERFCMLPAYRGKGLGRETMLHLSRRYKKNGVQSLIVHAKYDACDFYVRCGFHPVSNKFFEADVPHIKMEKQL